MRWIAFALATSVVLGACGSSPIEKAENCTELQLALTEELQAVQAEVGAPSDIAEFGEFAGREDVQDIFDRKMRKATELKGKALAAGADSEADLCASMERIVGR